MTDAPIPAEKNPRRFLRSGPHLDRPHRRVRRGRASDGRAGRPGHGQQDPLRGALPLPGRQARGLSLRRHRAAADGLARDRPGQPLGRVEDEGMGHDQRRARALRQLRRRMGPALCLRPPPQAALRASHRHLGRMGIADQGQDHRESRLCRHQVQVRFLQIPGPAEGEDRPLSAAQARSDILHPGRPAPRRGEPAPACRDAHRGLRPAGSGLRPILRRRPRGLLPRRRRRRARLVERFAPEGIRDRPGRRRPPGPRSRSAPVPSPRSSSPPSITTGSSGSSRSSRSRPRWRSRSGPSSTTRTCAGTTSSGRSRARTRRTRSSCSGATSIPGARGPERPTTPRAAPCRSKRSGSSRPSRSSPDGRSGSSSGAPRRKAGSVRRPTSRSTSAT